jgi:peptidoglycan/LPS O-acetylase OafA/YrhL
MPSKVSEAVDNFDSLRFLFAACVAIFHFFALSGALTQTAIYSALSLGADISVSGFFILSGYLVLGSFQRSSSLRTYAEKRFRRLYPAYATVILVCTITALLISAPARGDMSAVAKYLGANLIFLNFLAPNLPGVFEDNRLPAVNGALWTLKIEVAFYCLLPLIAIAAKKLRSAKWALFVTLYVGAELWRAIFREGGGSFAMMAHQLPGQMSYFVTGMLLWEARNTLTANALIASACLAIVAGSYQTPSLEWSRAAALGLIVIAIAKAPIKLPRVGRYGDFSYGLYIAHFPIIQAVLASGAQLPIWAQAAVAAGLTVLASMLLWRFVERPLLHAGSHYKRTTVVA